MTCVICEHRPARFGGICNNCQAKIESDKRKCQADKPVKYATYRGHVVGFFRNGGGKLVPQILRRKAENLPKKITLDLNPSI